MKDKLTLKFLLLCFFTALFIISCKKDGGDEHNTDGEGAKAAIGRSARAKYNNKLMKDVGNVYIADNISKNGKPQLYSRVDYGEDKLTYYVSPLSDKDLGTDHRLVYGALDARQRIIELDEEKRSFRFYTQHNGSRLPLLLDVIQHGNSQYELKLFYVDWDKGSQAILGSVYLRNGQTVGISKQSSIAGNSKFSTTMNSPTLGFLGCQRPSKQETPVAEIGAYLGYI